MWRACGVCGVVDVGGVELPVGLDAQVVAVPVGRDGAAAAVAQDGGGDSAHAGGVVGDAAVGIAAHARGLREGSYN